MRPFWLLTVILALSSWTGCMQLQMLPHLDQALTLKEFGAEKDEQHKEVQSIDAKFDELLAAIASGEISKYKTESEVVKKFGPPLFCEDTPSPRQCLYRYAIQSKGPQKVYISYGPQSQVLKIDR